jgi:hypothetical protein
MKVIYYCQNCDKIINSVYLQEEQSPYPPSLTVEEVHDIIKKNYGNNYYTPSLCNDCLKELYGDNHNYQGFSIS